MKTWVITTLCYAINLFLLPINYHFASTTALTVSLDAVGGAVETFGTFILFMTIVSFISYYRNAFLNIFKSDIGGVVSENKTKLQVLTKSTINTMTAKAATIKNYFNNLLK